MRLQQRIEKTDELTNISLLVEFHFFTDFCESIISKNDSRKCRVVF